MSRIDDSMNPDKLNQSSQSINKENLDKDSDKEKNWEEHEGLSEETDRPRLTVIPDKLDFSNTQLSKEEQRLLETISKMPETTLDDVTAKVVTFQSVMQKNPIPDSVEMNLYVVRSGLALLHTYDADHGEAWLQNERKNPLKEMPIIGNEGVDVKQGPTHCVQDMSYYQLPSEELEIFQQMINTKQSVDVTSQKDVSETRKTVEVVSSNVEREQNWGVVSVLQKDNELYVQSDKWADGYNDSFGGTRTVDDAGIVHYDGVLGTFSYDPREFQLQVMDVKEDEFGNPATSFPVLKYIGEEMDGSKIQIPEGLQDASFMFEGNQNLKSLPKLPSSVESAFCMCKDCSNLTQAATFMFPRKLKEAQFMFANCGKLETGPAVVNVKDATGMFANCPELLTTPKIALGLEYADCMFENCEHLNKKPKWPIGVKSAEYATDGCTGIDDEEVKRHLKDQEKARVKFEKKQNKKTLGDHAGRFFSACMQVHALTVSGHNILHAMYLTHALRQAGTFTRDIAGGWSALYKADRSNLNQFMMVTSQNNAAKKAARNYARTEDTNAFRATNTVRKTSSKGDRVMYNNGFRAMSAHYFEKVGANGVVASKKHTTAAQLDADELAGVMNLRAQKDTLSVAAKKVYAKQALEMVSNHAAYYTGASDCLNQKNGPVKNRQDAERGLNDITIENMQVMAHTIQDLQKRHNFLNKRQFADICDYMKQTPYGKTDDFKQFVSDMTDDLKGRAQYHKVEQEANVKERRRQSYNDAARNNTNRRRDMNPAWNKFDEEPTVKQDGMSL